MSRRPRALQRTVRTWKSEPVGKPAAKGRTLAEFLPLKPAEERLLEACKCGEVATVSVERPTEATDENTVRAAFLRFLLLGGDETTAIHEHGVQIKGAYIYCKLDISSATVMGMVCENCYFEGPIDLGCATINGGLSLDGCYVPGIKGDGLTLNRTLSFSKEFQSFGEVSLIGLQLDGDLVCRNASFNEPNGDAISLDGAVVKGDISLDSCKVSAGEVRLLGVQISGDLSCKGAVFKILTNGKNSDSLSMDSAAIKGSVFLCGEFEAEGKVRLNNTQIDGALDISSLKKPLSNIILSSTKVGILTDDKTSWGENIALNGFEYRIFHGDKTPKDAESRLDWLDKQSAAHSGKDASKNDFRPQPWRQLEKTLRAMGHNEDARQVAIAFEDRLREADLIGRSPDKTSKLMRCWNRESKRALHWFFKVLTGYGYRPLRLVYWMVGVWLGCGVFYWCVASTHAVIGPTNPLIFQDKLMYDQCSPKSPLKKGNWFFCDKLQDEYTTFSPLTYSLDVILPLVDLQQQKDWGTLIKTPKEVWYEELFAFSWNHVTRLVIWFETLFGWVASLLLVAILSGLTKRREE
jgi:hypothetical protein